MNQLWVWTTRPVTCHRWYWPLIDFSGGRIIREWRMQCHNIWWIFPYNLLEILWSEGTKKVHTASRGNPLESAILLGQKGHRSLWSVRALSSVNGRWQGPPSWLWQPSELSVIGSGLLAETALSSEHIVLWFWPWSFLCNYKAIVSLCQKFYCELIPSHHADYMESLYPGYYTPFLLIPQSLGKYLEQSSDYFQRAGG